MSQVRNKLSKVENNGYYLNTWILVQTRGFEINALEATLDVSFFLESPE